MKKKKFKLREYQDKNHHDIINLFQKHNSVLYQLPTGGGKTVIIQEIIDKIVSNNLPEGVKDKIGNKILILVHRREIIFQIRDRLNSQGIKCGVLIGQHEENLDSDILVASNRTVMMDDRIDNIIQKHSDFLIIDEAHHACSNGYKKIIKAYKKNNPKSKLLGVTATPYRKDKKSLGDIFNVLKLGPTIQELQELGYLCKSKTYALNLEDLKNNVEFSGGDFKISQLSKYMRQKGIIEMAIKEYEDKGEEKQMLVFCVDKKHSLDIKKAYEDKGYSVGHIDSDTSKDVRDGIIEDFRENKIQIITSIQTLTEGVDLPETGVIQFLRPTLSLVLYMQMGGRGLRPKKDGSDLIVLDIANNSREHGLLDAEREWSLKKNDPNLKRKKNKIVGVGPNGSIVENVSDIEAEGLELTELSPEEYFMRKGDGLIEAEEKNKDLKRKKYSLYLELIKTANSFIKIPNHSFKPKYTEDQVVNGYSNNLTNLTLSDNENERNVCTISFHNWSEDEKFLHLQGDFYISRGAKLEAEKSLKLYSIMGGVASKMETKKINNILITSFEEIEEVNQEMVDIQEIKRNIKRFEEKQIELKVNEKFINKKYTLELEKEIYLGSYCRDLWRYANKIIFTDNPRSLRSINKVEFYNDKGYVGGVSSFKKEDVIDVLINNLK